MFKLNSINPDELALIALRIERLQLVIAMGLHSHGFIGTKDQGKIIPAHADIQKKLKELLLKLNDAMSELESKWLRYQDNYDVYLANVLQEGFVDYKAKMQAQINAVKITIARLDPPLLIPHQQQAHMILEDIEQCFESTQAPLAFELKQGLRYKLFKLSLQSLNELNIEQPTCFICYAWGNAASVRRVHQIATDLMAAGVKVKLDIWDNTTGAIPVFLDLIDKVNYVIVMGTPDLVEKWENYASSGESRQQTGEDYQGNVVAQELERIERLKTKRPANHHGIIAVLLDGEHATSFPASIESLPSDDTDFRHKVDYPTKFLNLIKKFYAKLPQGLEKIASLQKELTATFYAIERLEQNAATSFYKQCEKNQAALTLALFNDKLAQVMGENLNMEALLVSCFRTKYLDPSVSMLKRFGYEVYTPIKESFVNLAIILEEKHKDAERMLTQLESRIGERPLHAFENIHELKEKMPLSVLFAAYENQKAKPHIVIEGRAGVGKTTLCQYIVNQWALDEKERHSDMAWLKEFDLVVWLPLRQLCQTTTLDLAEILFESYKAYRPESAQGMLSADSFKKAFEAYESQHRVLYLFDGLDEIGVLRQGNAQQKEFLKKLWTKKHWIITSRPYHATKQELGDFRHLENIGFNAIHIKKYVEQFFKDFKAPLKGQALLSVLQQNPNIQGIAHIPINLEILCSVFQEKLQDNNAQNLTEHFKNLTMTSLYQEILISLLRRHLQRLKETKLLAVDYSIADLTDAEVLAHERCLPLVDFLDELAFQMMAKADLEVKPTDYSDLITKYCPDIQQRARFNSDVFRDLGILKAVGEHKTDLSKQHYYFVHLTFQEFFAAYHIAKKLKQNDANLTTFIKQHKYHPKYEINWWFVAGLLKGNARALEHFFDCLEEEPIDLVGLTHQLLILRCLDECELTLASKRKQDLLTALIQWIRFEILHGKRYKINSVVTYLSLSQQVLKDSSIHGYFISLLKDSTVEVRVAAAKVLGQQVSLPEVVQYQLVDLLKDLEEETREAAALALGKQASLPEAIQDQLVDLLKDPTGGVRWAAAGTLEQQASLLEAVQAQLVDLLKDLEEETRVAAARILGQQASLPEAIQAQLVALLKDPAREVKVAGAEALGRQASLPEAIQDQLVALLKDPAEEGIRWEVVTVLVKQARLPKTAQDQLVALLKDPVMGVRLTTTMKLGQQASLPEAIQDQLVALLKDPTEGVRWAAAGTLEQQASLPEAIQAQLVALFKDPAEGVRWTAVKALAKQTRLPKAAQAQLVALLKDPAVVVRVATAVALGNQESLPEAVQDQLVALLIDPAIVVRAAAAGALGNQESLPETIQTQLVALLKDPAEEVKWAAVGALGQQASLPETIQTQLVALLKDPAEWIRRAATQAFCKQTSLPEAVQGQLVALLKEPEEEVREAAAGILGNQPTLTKNILQQLGALISIVNEAAIALQKVSYNQVINYINFSQLCIEWLPLLKVLLLKCLQQRISLYFVGNELYIEKTTCGDFNEQQKIAFVKTTRQILAKFSPHFVKEAPGFFYSQYQRIVALVRSGMGAKTFSTLLLVLQMPYIIKLISQGRMPTTREIISNVKLSVVFVVSYYFLDKLLNSITYAEGKLQNENFELSFGCRNKLDNINYATSDAFCSLSTIADLKSICSAGNSAEKPRNLSAILNLVSTSVNDSPPSSFPAISDINNPINLFSRSVEKVKLLETSFEVACQLSVMKERPVLQCSGESYTTYVFPKVPATFVVTAYQPQNMFYSPIAGDCYDKSSCRAVELYGRSSIYCEGEKTTLVYQPQLPSPPLQNIDGQLMLFAVGAYVIKQTVKWFKEPTESAAEKKAQKRATAEYKNAQLQKFKNILNAIERNLKQIDKKFLSNELKWIVDAMDDYRYDIEKLNRRDMLTVDELQEMKLNISYFYEQISEELKVKDIGIYQTVKGMNFHSFFAQTDKQHKVDYATLAANGAVQAQLALPLPLNGRNTQQGQTLN